MLTCKVGSTIINCFDELYGKYTLKKWSEENRLICPDCKKSYEYCHGEVVSPYFRHKEKSKECDAIYSEPETEEHIKGKQILYKWLIGLQDKGVVSDVKLESYIAETRQRPDLFFVSNGKRFVMEFQCSPIATEYIERHRLYQLAGVHDIWILGTDKYIKKSETKTSFREKAIEKHTNLYLDSKYNTFIFSNIDQLDIKNNYRIKSVCNYYYQDKRSLASSCLLSFDQDVEKYMIDVDGVEFTNGKILLTQESLNNIKEYSELIIKEEVRLQKIDEKCKMFLGEVFQSFEDMYATKLNSMSCRYGFKCNKHYYQFTNIDKYPNVDFCEIKYTGNNYTHNLIFSFNIEDGNTDKIIEYLKLALKESIELNIEFNNLKIKYEENRKNKLVKLQQELLQFHNKPLYLLFLEDNHVLNKSLKFKVVHNYPDDIVDIGKTILENLKFIESKGAKEYILMIPRKRIRQSSSSLYSCYKVRNYKSNVINDFIDLGIDFLEYADLRRTFFD